MRPEDVRNRREPLRLSVAELARLAGLDKHTVHRIEDNLHSPVTVTLQAIERALVAEERRVLAHLLALHPDALSPAAPVPPVPPMPAPAGASLAPAGAIYPNGVAA